MDKNAHTHRTKRCVSLFATEHGELAFAAEEMRYHQDLAGKLVTGIDATFLPLARHLKEVHPTPCIPEHIPAVVASKRCTPPLASQNIFLPWLEWAHV